ncbi:MAG TPA: hypothetical protein VFM55_10900 [Micromonosporaceae bacterium]|nr:hypothetical protein [Micromonosporaceae bacterium]
MANTWWNDDDRLIAMLGEALREADAVPRELADAGRAAYAWRGIDAELAALVYDSEHEPTATRTDTATLRALTFASPRLSIELEVVDGCLIGQVVPPGAARVELQTPDGETASFTADELGCFTVGALPGGPFRLRCRMGASVDVLTSWITL